MLLSLALLVRIAAACSGHNLPPMYTDLVASGIMGPLGPLCSGPRGRWFESSHPDCGESDSLSHTHWRAYLLSSYTTAERPPFFFVLDDVSKWSYASHRLFAMAGFNQLQPNHLKPIPSKRPPS